MDIQDIQEVFPLNSLKTDDGVPSARASAELAHFEEKPKTEHDVWDRVRHGHVATALRLRSLLLFIASTIMSYLESVSGPEQNQKNPKDLIAGIVAGFINGNRDYQRSFGKDTFLDILIAKLPDRDCSGMRFHEVYLSISPLITSVNWTRLTFDRTDAMRCYNSLANVLHVCFDQVVVTNRSEADQLVLAIYVSSVWCSIIKQHPELALQSNTQTESEDFETHMKTWIFHPYFENFSRVFVASCCHLMDSMQKNGEVMEKRHADTETTSPRGPPEIESIAPLVYAEPIPQITTPTIPFNIHPSWQIPGQYPVYEPDRYMLPFHPGIYQPQHAYSTISFCPKMEQQTSAARRAPQKRKAVEKSHQLPNFQQLTDTLTKPRCKKGPKPGTRYRERITREATMILQVEAAIMEQTDSRMSKKEISRRTNISLYQVKSFFNRITAEKKRMETGRPVFRTYNRWK